MKQIWKIAILSAGGALLAVGPATAQSKGGTLTVGMDRPMTGFDSSMNPRPEYKRRNAMLPIY